MKPCTICKEVKELRFFPKEPRMTDGHKNQCTPCRNRANRNSKTRKNTHLTKTYGITLTQYNQLLTNQNSCCLICKRHRSILNQDLHTDHDHTTGEVRGLLCFNCNQGLGNFKDSVEFLKSAIEYLGR